jgi:hypothetical protein
VISTGRNVEHVFDPFIAVGDLKFVPVGVIVLEAAVPVEVESENVFVEMVHGGAVFDDEAGVEDARADGVGRRRVDHGNNSGACDEGNAIAFGVADLKVLIAVSILENPARFHTVSHEEEAEFEDVIGGKGKFREPIFGSGRGYLLEFNVLEMLAPGNRKARVAHGSAPGVCGKQSEDADVKGAGFIEVCGVEADVVNARDRWARKPILRSESGKSHK